MGDYLIPAIRLSQETGKRIELVRRVLTSMQPGTKRASTALVVRELIASGVDAFLARPDVVAHLERHGFKVDAAGTGLDRA